MSLHVHGKHINSCTTKSAHLYQHVCHFMYMNQKETYQLMYHEKRTSISTRMSLHVHEPEGNISTHVPRKVHSVSTRMSLHVHECQRINTYVTSCTWETYQLMYHEKCTAYQHVCHFMYMNQKETYQLMYHEKCTAYQHVCHFMYMNQKETYQLMYT